MRTPPNNQMAPGELGQSSIDIVIPYATISTSILFHLTLILGLWDRLVSGKAVYEYFNPSDAFHSG
jgi:hypothetical protein